MEKRFGAQFALGVGTISLEGPPFHPDSNCFLVLSLLALPTV